MSLREQLDAIRQAFETNQAPPNVVQAVQRAISELIEDGVAYRALKAGEVAPLFSLPDTANTLVALRDLLSTGPVVLTFYRGMWCPFCNTDLQAMEAMRSVIEAHGAQLVAVSPQTVANSLASREENKLGFPVLSDQGARVAAAFGLRWNVPAYLRDIHDQLGANLEQFNGDESWTLPVPARYVIDQDGVIAYAHVGPDYSYRPEPTDVLPVLDLIRRTKRR